MSDEPLSFEEYRRRREDNASTVPFHLRASRF
jgi:hypothetical protein